MSQPTVINITLDLDAYLARHVRYDEDGEEVTEPLTVEEIVLDLVARQLLDRVVLQGNASGQRTWSDDIRDKVAAVRVEVIRERIVPLVEEALATHRQRTNDWGEPQGEPTTLREEVTKAAERYLVEYHPDSRHDRRQTRVQKFVADEVARQLDRELQGALAAAKAEVTAAVRERGAAVLAQTIAQMAGGQS